MNIARHIRRIENQAVHGFLSQDVDLSPPLQERLRIQIREAVESAYVHWREERRARAEALRAARDLI